MSSSSQISLSLSLSLSFIRMAPKDENYDEDYYGEAHNNRNWGNEREEYDDDYESSSKSNQSQDIEIDRNVYWQSQESLLQEILDRHGTDGLKMKKEIALVIEMARKTSECVCLPPKSSSCCKCSRRKVVNALCSKRFCATLSTSKWRQTSILQGGTHEYIEVLASSHSKKNQVRFLIELNFRDEFKMAKACDEYHNLINQVPETFVGKYKHLNAIVRLLCDAAKRSAWEKRIHIGPWRKRSFMLKKWSASGLLNQSFCNNNELDLVSKPSARDANIPLSSCCSQIFSSASAVEAI